MERTVKQNIITTLSGKFKVVKMVNKIRYHLCVFDHLLIAKLLKERSDLL